MIYLAFLAIGVLAGLGLAWIFGRFAPEEQSVCILNCVDGTEHRATCVSTQEKQCFDVLRKKCDPDFEPESER